MARLESSILGRHLLQGAEAGWDPEQSGHQPIGIDGWIEINAGGQWTRRCTLTQEVHRARQKNGGGDITHRRSPNVGQTKSDRLGRRLGLGLGQERERVHCLPLLGR